jgi:LysM repeat protein
VAVWEGGITVSEDTKQEEIGGVELIEDDTEQLERDESPEAAAEAGLTEAPAQVVPPEEVEFEDDDAPVAMSPLPLAWMKDALRKNGLKVKAVAGWASRGRPFSFSPRAVVFHHTASRRTSGPAPSLGVCVKGRADVPGPLCHLMIGRDGTVFLVAAGRANHAGLGGPFRNIPEDSMNSFAIGVEVENDGVGERWSKELLEVCDRVFATLLVGLRRTPSWLIGHKEWAPGRKIDPGNLEMGEYRRRVRAEIPRLGRLEKGGEKEPKTKSPAAGQPKQTGADEPKLKADVYEVVAGDTLFSISRRHGMTVQELKALNGLESDLIHPGDRLKVKASQAGSG